MYLYEIYLSDGHDYGGDFKLVSKTKYSQEEFESIVAEAKRKCDTDKYDYEIINKLGNVLLTHWDFEEAECLIVNVLDV